jgi:hypothetical protein
VLKIDPGIVKATVAATFAADPPPVVHVQYAADPRPIETGIVEFCSLETNRAQYSVGY